MAGQVSEEFEVPQHLKKQTCGSRNKRLKRLRETHNVQIVTNNSKTNQSKMIFEVSGEAVNVQSALLEFDELLKNAAKNANVTLNSPENNKSIKRVKQIVSNMNKNENNNGNNTDNTDQSPQTVTTTTTTTAATTVTQKTADTTDENNQNETVVTNETNQNNENNENNGNSSANTDNSNADNTGNTDSNDQAVTTVSAEIVAPNIAQTEVMDTMESNSNNENVNKTTDSFVNVASPDLEPLETLTQSQSVTSRNTMDSDIAIIDTDLENEIEIENENEIEMNNESGTDKNDITVRTDNCDENENENGNEIKTDESKMSELVEIENDTNDAIDRIGTNEENMTEYDNGIDNVLSPATSETNRDGIGSSSANVKTLHDASIIEEIENIENANHIITPTNETLELKDIVSDAPSIERGRTIESELIDNREIEMKEELRENRELTPLAEKDQIKDDISHPSSKKGSSNRAIFGIVGLAVIAGLSYAGYALLKQHYDSNATSGAGNASNSKNKGN